MPSVNSHLWIYEYSDEPGNKLLLASPHSHYWSHFLFFAVLPFSLVYSQEIITTIHICVLVLLFSLKLTSPSSITSDNSHDQLCPIYLPSFLLNSVQRNFLYIFQSKYVGRTIYEGNTETPIELVPLIFLSQKARGAWHWPLNLIHFYPHSGPGCKR